MALTAEQAALRLNRKERTVRRWIAEGKLAAFHPTHGRKDKYLIEESDIERLATELAQYEPPVTTLDTSTIARIEQRLEKIEQRLEKVEQQISGTTPDASQVVPESPAEPRTRTPRQKTTEPPVDIPPGSLIHSEFAERHNVKASTFRDHITVGIKGDKVDALAIPIPNREGQYERWLTPEQQIAAIAYWQRHNKPYQVCKVATCPVCSEQEQEA